MKNLPKPLIVLSNLLKPPRVFGWLSLFYYSIYIWMIAWVVGNVFKNPTLQNSLSFWGCILLLIGYSWFAAERPLKIEGFSINYWILGLLICIFLAGFKNRVTPLIWLIWPPLSATLAVWPEFVGASRNFKIPSPEVRAKLLIWFFSHLVITCWVQFNVLIQNWIQQYPNVLTDDFSRSVFMVKIEYPSVPTNRGVEILEQMETQLQAQISGKPWYKAEQLQKHANQRKNLKEQAMKQLPNVKEKVMWKILDPKVSASKSGYNLELVAQWRGLGSNPNGYDLKKLCQVNSAKQPTSSTRKRRDLRKPNSSCKGCDGAAGSGARKKAIATPEPERIAQVKCNPVSKQILR